MRPKSPEGPTRKSEPLHDEPSLLGVLVCVDDRASLVPLPAHGSLVFGRSEECDVVVGHDSVSRQHVRVAAGTPPTVEDLGSTNGTRVNGRRLEPGERCEVAIGAVIEVGGTMLIMQRAGSAIAAPIAEIATATSSAVVVRDAVMLQLYQLIRVIAPANLCVLILGETGVGKEVFAEAIHTQSPRRAKGYLRLNCAALPESILEGELFGYERGAFTGATQAKQGLFESADGGTVFLDEIGELPLTMQAKLLRVLESGEVMRLGSVKPKHVDVRFVSATNRDLQARVADGQFRADLFFRINGIVLTIPPLRKRPEDAIALAEHFVDRAAGGLGRRPPRLAEDARAAILAYAWPGNIRELRNTIDRAVLLCPRASLHASDLALNGAASFGDAIPESPGAEALAIPRPASATPTLTPAAYPAGPLLPDLEEYEKRRIMEALDECAGNQTRAAKALGIARRTLVTKLDTYGLARPRKGR